MKRELYNKKKYRIGTGTRAAMYTFSERGRGSSYHQVDGNSQEIGEETEMKGRGVGAANSSELQKDDE